MKHNPSLPIAIADLVHGRSVEWARLEFRRDLFSPKPIQKSLVAFAPKAVIPLIEQRETNGRRIFDEAKAQGLSEAKIEEVHRGWFGGIRNS